MKKGFTLIELLAVIVILAIIALIATPIVLNIINDTKKSATIRSADFYVNAVQNEIMLENMKSGGTFNPNVCKIETKDNVLGLYCDGKLLNVKVDGEVPIGGNITFSEGKITGVHLEYPSGTIIRNSKGELVFGDPVCELVSGQPNAIGSKYQCKVKDDMAEGYYFFVLSHNNDGTTNLIMDRNICHDGTTTPNKNSCFEAWIGSSTYGCSGDLCALTDKGPVTAMNYLYNATKDWDNISNIVMNYIDEGNNYGTITTINNVTNITKKDGSIVTVLMNEEGYINLKARMPYKKEVSNYDINNRFLYNNLHLSCLDDRIEDVDCQDATTIYGIVDDKLEHMNEMWGYWTLSSKDNVSVYRVSFDGSVSESAPESVGITTGVRPVITMKL